MTMHRTAGFTLIELLVAVGILLLITGFGIANLIGFNDRQQVQAAASGMQSFFRTAQTKARVKQAPQDCALEGYRVQRTAGAPQLTLSARCRNEANPAAPDYIAVETWTIPDFITSFGPNAFAVEYLTLYGTAVLYQSAGSGWVQIEGDELDFTLQGQAASPAYSFSIGSGGDITTGGFE